MKKMTLTLIIVWCVIGALVLGALVSGMVWGNFGHVVLGNVKRLSLDNLGLVADLKADINGIDTITLDFTSDDCKVIPVDGNEISVKQYGKNLPDYRVVQLVKKGDELLVTTTDTVRIGFNFGFINEYSNVEVYLPRAYKENFYIDLTSGSVEIADTLDLKEFHIEMSSGEVYTDSEIKSDYTLIDITSGSVDLEGGLITDDYLIETTSGSVTVEKRLTGSGRIDITSGDVELSGVEIGENLDIESTSGYIEIEVAGNPSLDFRADVVSGDVDTYFKTYRDDDDIYVATVGDEPYKDVNVDITSGTVVFKQAA